MDIFLREFQVGPIRIELSVQGNEGCKAMFTAKDSNNEILWRTPITDENGAEKTYRTANDAYNDAKARLRAYEHH